MLSLLKQLHTSCRVAQLLSLSSRGYAAPNGFRYAHDSFPFGALPQTPKYATRKIHPTFVESLLSISATCIEKMGCLEQLHCRIEPRHSGSAMAAPERFIGKWIGRQVARPADSPEKESGAGTNRLHAPFQALDDRSPARLAFEGSRGAFSAPKSLETLEISAFSTCSTNDVGIRIRFQSSLGMKFEAVARALLPSKLLFENDHFSTHLKIHMNPQSLLSRKPV